MRLYGNLSERRETLDNVHENLFEYHVEVIMFHT
jgi:hypothetical protein